MTKAITLKLPGKNLTTLPISSIRSITLQAKGDANDDDLLIIGIEGWQKPFTYESTNAYKVYENVISNFDVSVVRDD